MATFVPYRRVKDDRGKELAQTKTNVQAKQSENWFEETALWKLKVRLQFSGWLQYLIHAVAILFMLLLAGIGWLIGYWPVFFLWLPLGVAAALSIPLIGSILIVKYGMHPTERLPAKPIDLDAFDLMRVRHSCRSFQSRKLSPDHRTELMEIVHANSQPDRQLGRRPIRFEYVESPLKVWPVVGAHEFLVAIAPHEYDRLAVIDIGRSLQKVVLHATGMGLATCWIGPGADQKSIVQHLGDRFDPTRDHVICVCAIGYESRYKPPAIRLIQRFQRHRLPLSALFFTDRSFTSSLETSAEPFSEYGRCYEVCQWSPSSFNGQTTRCAAVTERSGDADKLVRFDFCASTNSRYYAAVALGIWCANWEMGCQALGRTGYFTALPSEFRATESAPHLPRYDVSWVID
jgi:nitroreductase